MDTPQELVQRTRGSAAQILLAFIFARKAMDVDEIHEWTGLKRETIYSAMPLLKKVIVPLTEAHGRIVYHPAWNLIPAFQPALEAVNPQESTFRTPAPSSSSSSFNGREKNLKLEEVEEETQESAKRTPESQMSTKRTPAKTAHPEIEYEEHGVTFEKNMDACRRVHIGPPLNEEISMLSWASPEFIKAHVASLEIGETVGYAIRRIQAGETPRVWEEEIKQLMKEGKMKSRIEEKAEPEQMQCVHREEMVRDGPYGPRVFYQTCHNPAVPGTMYCQDHQDEVETEAADEETESDTPAWF